MIQCQLHCISFKTNSKNSKCKFLSFLFAFASLLTFPIDLTFAKQTNESASNQANKHPVATRNLRSVLEASPAPAKTQDSKENFVTPESFQASVPAFDARWIPSPGPLVDVTAYSILTNRSGNASAGLTFGKIYESKIQSKKLTGKLVKKSIGRGIKFLLSRKSDDRWPDYATYRNGPTALATLALLNAGVKPDDPRIERVVEELSRVKPTQTYVASLITMVLANSKPKKYRNSISRNVKWLEKIQNRSGGWGYGNFGGVGSDASNSQFAILALHEAQMVGVDVDIQTWKSAKRYWEAVYNRTSGGFRYKSNAGTAVTGSMTCAGISSMVIINENLNLGSSQIRNGKVVCCGRSQSNEMIEKSIRWLGRNFRISKNPGRGEGAFSYYYKYSVERAGRLTGQRYFGRRDWYREIAANLCDPRIQGIDGSWTGRRNVENSVIATSMSLLFLSKGLRPILASKYQYSDGSQWNRHPQGIHYLTRFTEKIWQTKLNWQSIDGRKAEVNDLLETPVLMISGDGPMNLSNRQKERLKAYVDNGGFLFIEANLNNGCPNANAFNKEVRGLLAEWFPDSKLKALSPDHPVWTSQFKVKPRQQFALLGIESCCRTSVIYCTAPISGFWQLKTPGSKRLPQEAAKQIDYASKLGVNILAFATGNVLKDRLDRPKVDGENAVSVLGRQMIVGKIQHNAGYNDAPASLGNLIRRANTEKGLQFHPQFKILPTDANSVQQYPILFVHGRGEIRFSDEQKKVLKSHLDMGGFLFGDAICGDKLFYSSFKKEIASVLEGSQWETLDKDHPIFSSKYNGYDISSVQRRTKESGGKFVRKDVMLEGIKLNDKYQILFSKHDISCALENGTSKTCYGYTQDDATRIGINVLLYALHP